LIETLETMMAEEEAILRREEKQCWEKEAACATFIDLTKQALQVQKLATESKLVDDKAKLLAEESRIMLANLSIIDADQRACFEKKHTTMLQCDAWSHLSISIVSFLFNIETCLLLHMDKTPFVRTWSL
jgi:hypothetical protein